MIRVQAVHTRTDILRAGKVELMLVGEGGLLTDLGAWGHQYIKIGSIRPRGCWVVQSDAHTRKHFGCLARLSLYIAWAPNTKIQILGTIKL